MRFVLLTLFTAAVVAVSAYQFIAAKFTNNKPQVLQVQVSQEVSPTPTEKPSPTPTPSPTPMPVLTITPTLTPIPTVTLTPTSLPLPPVPATQEEIQVFIERFAAQYEVDPSVLRHIGVCESGLNPLAINGPYAGIYQFSQSAWQSNRIPMGEDVSPALRFNAEESVQTAAYALSMGKAYLWPNCLP